MFARLSTFVLLALPLLAIAAPTPDDDRPKCSTGDTYCCNRTDKNESVNYSKDDIRHNFLAALLGAQGTNVPVDSVTCSKFNIVGAGGGSCSGQVACMLLFQNGVVNLECNAIKVL